MQQFYLSVMGAKAIGGGIIVGLCSYCDTSNLKDVIYPRVKKIEGSPLDWFKGGDYAVIESGLNLDSIDCNFNYLEVRTREIDTPKFREVIQNRIARLFAETLKSLKVDPKSAEFIFNPELESNITVPKNFNVRPVSPNECLELTYSYWLCRRVYREHLLREDAIYKYSITTEEPTFTIEQIEALITQGPSFEFHRLKAIKRLPNQLQRALDMGLVPRNYSRFFEAPPNWWWQFFKHEPFAARKLNPNELRELVEKQRQASTASRGPITVKMKNFEREGHHVSLFELNQYQNVRTKVFN